VHRGQKRSLWVGRVVPVFHSCVVAHQPGEKIEDQHCLHRVGEVVLTRSEKIAAPVLAGWRSGPASLSQCCSGTAMWQRSAGSAPDAVGEKEKEHPATSL
jgi:hypothetical protein